MTVGFQPGQSGNPAGKPRGAKNLTTRAVAALLEGEAEALTRKAISMALNGDGPALKLCMDRLCPPKRDRMVEFDAPPIVSPADLPRVTAALVAAAAAGEMTFAEAADFMKIVAGHIEALKTSDFAERLAAIEAAENQGGQS